MRKVSLFVAVAALSVGTLVSCGKSTKGKMDGEWNIDSMSTTSTYTASNGDVSSEVESYEGTTYKSTSTDQNGSVTVTGTVNASSWNIKKDGTWDRELTYTLSGSGYTYKTTEKSSGKWDFATGVGEFKKNERVVFSTTSATTTEVSTVGSVSQTTTDTDTYLDGENTMVFVITESKKKNLEMEAEGSNTSTSGNSSTTSSYKATVKMTLK